VIDFEVRGRTALLTINRPEARNAVNAEVATGLEAAIDRLEADERLWAGVLTGAGPVFCAGADLKLFTAGREREMFTERGSFAGIVTRARTKPLVAAVDGAALAGGCEIALACDLIVASTEARFGLPEVSRSLIASAGGLARLPRVLPVQVATKLALTADTIDAERAYELGMVAELAPAGEAVQAALALAERINANAPLAVRQTLRILRAGADQSFDDTFAQGLRASRELASTEDYREGPRAFVEKRSARWQGR
jgi:enoyl-CoA hydratase/carnithine racemase